MAVACTNHRGEWNLHYLWETKPTSLPGWPCREQFQRSDKLVEICHLSMTLFCQTSFKHSFKFFCLFAATRTSSKKFHCAYMCEGQYVERDRRQCEWALINDHRAKVLEMWRKKKLRVMQKRKDWKYWLTNLWSGRSDPEFNMILHNIAALLFLISVRKHFHIWKLNNLTFPEFTPSACWNMWFFCLGKSEH